MYRQFTILIGCLRLNYSQKNFKKSPPKNFTTIHKKTENQNCVKSGLFQFLFLQQKMKYVDLIAIFIILLII